MSKSIIKRSTHNRPKNIVRIGMFYKQRQYDISVRYWEKSESYERILQVIGFKIINKKKKAICESVVLNNGILVEGSSVETVVAFTRLSNTVRYKIVEDWRDENDRRCLHRRPT